MNAQIRTASSADEQVEIQHGRKRPWLVLPTLAVVWLGMVEIGWSWMWEFEETLGEVTTFLTQWTCLKGTSGKGLS